jgi:hypothetical protein
VSATSPTAPAEPAAEKPRLFEQLRAVAAFITSPDIPSGPELAQMLGALIEALDRSGVSVPDEMLEPPPGTPPPAPAPVDERIRQLEARLAQLERPAEQSAAKPS